jgi:hypothetical protein
MVIKTYSYHVYQPKAKSKQGRFVDLDTKSTDANGRVRKPSAAKESRHPLVATSEAGPILCDNPQLTPQLFAATQQAILKSQQQQHAAAQSGAAANGFTASQYTFQTFKMKGRATQQPAKRTSVGSASATSIHTNSASPHPSNSSYYGQQPLAIRPLIVPDLAMPHSCQVCIMPQLSHGIRFLHRSSLCMGWKERMPSDAVFTFPHVPYSPFPMFHILVLRVHH